MKKKLILELDNEYGMMRNTENCDYYNYFKYSNHNKIQKVLKKTNLFISQFFLGDWKKNIKKYDVCILFDRGFNQLISKYIKKNNPKCKIILWLWNPVSQRHLKFMNDKNIDEVWTYDLKDSEKYNLKFNTQFYNKQLVSENEFDIEYDVMFIGNNKGRDKIIDKYKDVFKKVKLSTYIKVINNYKENIKYMDYIGYLKKSKCLLEIVKEDVSGLTLRALESIFFGKKLITNNKFIKEYKFYNSENIFILGEDNISDLNSFVNSEYKKNDMNIINFYDFEEWTNRFLEDRN